MYSKFNLILIVGLFLMGGCVARTYTIEKPRKDLDVRGNRGYLYGKPSKPAPTPSKKTRKVTVLEIEFGPTKEEEEIKKIPGIKEEEFKEEFEKEPEESLEEIVEEANLEEELEEEGLEEEEVPQKKYKMYTVKKGDTLQKISYKFYGTHHKWKKIFEANRDVLEDPNKVYPGQVLRIPQ